MTFLIVQINGVLQKFKQNANGTETSQLCGENIVRLEVTSGSNVELLLVTDIGGKYDQIENRERYESGRQANCLELLCV